MGWSFVACMVALGCTVEVEATVGGGPSDASTADVGPDGAQQAPASGCTSCLFESCGGLQSACNENLECLAIFNCATKVPCISDAACVQSCFDSLPRGQAAYLKLAQCNRTTACGPCGAACSASPARDECPSATTDAGPIPDAGDGSSDAGSGTPVDCVICQSKECTQEKLACGPESDCLGYSDCLSACVNGASDTLAQCINACATVYPDGKVKGAAFATCTESKCRKECLGS